MSALSAFGNNMCAILILVMASSTAVVSASRVVQVWNVLLASPNGLANVFLDMVDSIILSVDNILHSSIFRVNDPARVAYENELRRQQQGPTKSIVKKDASELLSHRISRALDGGKAHRLVNSMKKSRATSGKSPECNGQGWWRTTTQMYNCFGQQRPAEWLPDMERKDKAYVSCTTCATNNATCQAQCCTPIRTTAENRNYCSCPADRDGNRCQLSRSFHCSMQLLSPDLTCSSVHYDSMNQNIYANPQCTKFKQTDNVSFTVRIQCDHKSLLELNPMRVDLGTPPDYTAANFTYYTRRSNEFALSISPSLFLSYRVFNMYRLTDASMSNSFLLNGENLAGRETINFKLNMSDITNRSIATSMNGFPVNKPCFLVGGRLYMEIGLIAPVPNTGYEQSELLRTFIDFKDLPTSPPAAYMQTGVFSMVSDTNSQPGVIALIAIGALFVLGVAYAMIRGMKSKQKVA